MRKVRMTTVDALAIAEPPANQLKAPAGFGIRYSLFAGHYSVNRPCHAVALSNEASP